jgi:hypothetical protein
LKVGKGISDAPAFHAVLVGAAASAPLPDLVGRRDGGIGVAARADEDTSAAPSQDHLLLAEGPVITAARRLARAWPS